MCQLLFYSPLLDQQEIEPFKSKGSTSSSEVPTDEGQTRIGESTAAPSLVRQDSSDKEQPAKPEQRSSKGPKRKRARLVGPRPPPSIDLAKESSLDIRDDTGVVSRSV